METFQSHSYTHNLLDDGYNLGTATSGSIDVQLTDDADGAWEVILIVVDKFDFDTGGISFSTSATSFSGALEVNALAQINSACMLDITIASLWGDFYVGQSVLTVEVNSVPEPGALGMVAMGLIGLGVAGQKRKT